MLNSKSRPKHIKTQISMNFLFMGNPGTGKTTVAELLGAAMVELGFRQNPNPVFTSANDILGGQDPAADFADMIQQADNGTIFIDEAYNFNPAPRGSTANASNAVLDMLMKVTETKRDSISFILAGYKDEIQDLLQYNPGFPSRFPHVFDFPDYTASQLESILINLAKERNLRFQKKKECGVPLAKTLARRIAKGTGKKGFGNAREVRNRLEACIKEQGERLGTMSLYGKFVSQLDYEVLSRAGESHIMGKHVTIPLLRVPPPPTPHLLSSSLISLITSYPT